MSDEQRCGTCQWWASPEAIRNETIDKLNPTGCNYYGEHGECRRIVGGPLYDSDTRPAVMVGFESENVELMTLPTFGCTLWEKRDA